ncbi:glycine betaine ABC transporter substrate-binding protein [Streptomyces brevispora]|uniref:glycine betaine ABC transporter substrate-binding protein n=1 Tax=Streptomyces brevispora TaxID=887462 RepID=UPI0035D8FF81
MARPRTPLVALVSATALIAVAGCGAADMTQQSSPFANARGARTVTLSVQSWVGAQANVSDKKTISPGGELGVTGHIGWFVPTYFAKEHPDVTDWRNLNKYADRFRTAESGGKGQLLDGSPSYVTNDKALVQNLGLDYQVVFSGSEAAQITQIKQFAKEKKPFLSYWYKPQWLFAKVPMTEVRLPAYEDGCDADAKKVACAYPRTPLKKYLNARFAHDSGKAARFLKNFSWGTEDQNKVALMIADQKLSPQDAAKKWVDENEQEWRAWIPR